jgi:hypothetical protein
MGIEGERKEQQEEENGPPKNMFRAIDLVKAPLIWYWGGGCPGFDVR